MIGFFLKKRIEKLANIRVREKHFRRYEDIRRVVLLFDPENLSDVSQLVGTLRSDGKEVAAFGVDFKNNGQQPLPESFYVWNKKKFDVYGIPRPDALAEFVGYEADTLIDLTYSSQLAVKYLLVHSVAGYQIGIDRNDAQFYDLLVENTVGNDYAFFLEQLLFYLKSLRIK